MNIPSKLFVITSSMISNMLIMELSNKQEGKQLEIIGSKLDVVTISENVINSFILNGKSFPNTPYLKMDLVFLDKIINK
jgi:transaldolase